MGYALDKNTKQLQLYILTFNCARMAIDRNDFSSQLFNGLANGDAPDLIILSLQEIAPVAQSFLGGSYVMPYLERFQDAVTDAVKGLGIDDTYNEVVRESVGMTALLVFAKDLSHIQEIRTAGVGLGLCGMGNKGAVGARFTYREGLASTNLTVVAAHFAPTEGEVERRNRDWENTARRLVFSGSKVVDNTCESEDGPLLEHFQESSIYDPHSHLLVAGDLNYRTSATPPASNDYLEVFPQPHENSNSIKHHLALFDSDQLTQERCRKKTCHGLIEAPISFPPTYKYVSKEPRLALDEDLTKWHWAKHRWPSWCDRIQYLPVPAWLRNNHHDADIVALKYSALPLFPTSDHRPVALHLAIPLMDIPDPPDDVDQTDPRINPPYEIAKDWRERRQAARRLEVVAGITIYATTTWEGGVMALSTIIGFVGTVFILKALLAG